MTLVLSGDLVAAAAAEGRGILAFNVITLEHIEGVVEGARRAHRPVIIAVSQNAVLFHGGDLGPLSAAALCAARSSEIALALHLDHVEDPALLRQAADAGYSSAMFDAGHLPYRDNVVATREAATWAHDHGLWLEAELGYIGGKPGDARRAHAPGVRTDPDEAAAFVAATGVDALAVAVGSSHAMTTRTAVLDDELIGRLHTVVPVPLVLHGSSGVGDENLRRAIGAGMSKINFGTTLGGAYAAAVRDTLATDPGLVDPRGYLGPAREAIAAKVASLLTAVT